MKKLIFIALALLLCHAIKAQTLNLTFKKLASTKPISLKNSVNAKTLVISGDSIVGGTLACITLTNCTNIRITHCKLLNSSSMGIQLLNCSNITIDSNYISKVSSGVYAQNCPLGQLKVSYNSMVNMVGPYPRGQCVQFNAVSGGGNRITYNRFENMQGQSFPEDMINVYKSNGLATDPITVSYNWLRGGGPSTTGSGITVGDQGGSNISVLSNYVINSGSIGIQVAGGNNIKVMSNEIFSDVFPWSHLGLGCGNYSGLPSANITIGWNMVHWLSGSAVDQWKGSKSMEKDTSHQKGTLTPISWNTNTVNAAGLTKNVIPAAMAVVH